MEKHGNTRKKTKAGHKPLQQANSDNSPQNSYYHTFYPHSHPTNPTSPSQWNEKLRKASKTRSINRDTLLPSSQLTFPSGRLLDVICMHTHKSVWLGTCRPLVRARQLVGWIEILCTHTEKQRAPV